jgi:ubiquinone/menaquinone biosynthesis C-methylase UbiE
MPSLAVARVVLRELTTAERFGRTPEPDLVMDDPAKVAAYTRAGREDGVMAPVYLFHTAHMSEVIRPGDTVVDLACGPATQLAQLARLNPDVRFVGVDLSPPMLERAREHVAALGLSNVELRHGDITELTSFADASVDAVVSSMALHHLPTPALLERTFAQVRRVLRPGGGVYLADFARLHAEKSILYFAYQYADRQPELFTLDYLYSLKAAFSVDDFRRASAALGGAARLHRSFGAAFMVTLKSPARRALPPALVQELVALRDAMPAHHKTDFRDLKTVFMLGGLRFPAGL